jgi:phage shock protein A
LNEAEESLNKWNEKAQTAVKAGRDDLAREALKEKGKAETKIPQLQSQWAHLSEECERLKKELKIMEEKFEETLAKKEVMVAKAKVANARSSMAHTPPSSLKSEENQQAFSRADGKIRQMEADASAAKEMNDSFRSSNEKFDELERLQKELKIDDELAKLKEKIGS